MPVECCENMKRQLSKTCNIHANVFECADVLISYDAKFNEYGIIIHDGGSSSLLIEFCPWCGNRLPKSLRDRWFQELEERGFDPHSENIPEEYKSDAWWNVDK